MKTIKIILIAVLFISAYSASAQFTDNGVYSTTTDSIRIGYVASPYPALGLMLSVNGATYINGNLYCGNKLKAYNSTQRFDFGWGATSGSNIEFYNNNHASSGGQIKFVFGGSGKGNVNYLHYTGSGYESCLFINYNGNIGIGTVTPSSKLSVNGGISCSSITSSGALSCANISANGKITTKEVEVTLTGWPDYVFNDNYKLKPLSEVEQFIKENKHLPGIKSAKEIEENGLEIGEMNKQLMQKVEELTLYIIQLQKDIDNLKTSK